MISPVLILLTASFDLASGNGHQHYKPKLQCIRPVTDIDSTTVSIRKMHDQAGTYPFLGRAFLFSAGLLLSLTAVAKFVSALGTARILHSYDPLLLISYSHLMWIVGIIEMLVAVVCLMRRQIWLQAGLIAWLSSSFAFYRAGLLWIGYQKPCHCLGNLTDALHLPPQTADRAMKLVLAYLLVGSYATLYWLWRQKRKAARPLF